MKTFQLSLSAMLLLGLTVATVAQDVPTLRQRAMQLEGQRNATKSMMNSFWNGDGSSVMIAILLQQDIFREGIGVSKEQVQKITGASSASKQNDPYFKSLQDEMMGAIQEHGSPFDENISEEAQQKFTEIQSRMNERGQELTQKSMANAINENLTSEQLKKVKEFQISNMSEALFLSPNMFEVLDISADQKKQLDEITKELEPVYEKYSDRMIDVQSKLIEMIWNEYDKRSVGITDADEQRRLKIMIEDEMRKSNPEFQRAMHELMESGKELGDKLKIKMFDVLTDEQWNRMIGLIDNPPDYAKKMIAQLREKMGVNNSKPGEWAPGPNSWKPGDPIPEGYRQQRQERGRFPRVNQSE